MAGNKRQALATRKPRELFEPELVYQFWAAAGGVVQKAMELAAAAGEKRVPKKPHVWTKYATEYGFSERLAAEAKERWKKYHADREEREQVILDGIAETFEEFAIKFQQSMMLDFVALESEDRQIREGTARKLSKLFGNMKAVNQFFRMYLRARGQPETITRNIVAGAVPVTYADLDEPPKAKTPEEARMKAESNNAIDNGCNSRSAVTRLAHIVPLAQCECGVS